jgi:SagB-type dehydrogenase family enzyme
MIDTPSTPTDHRTRPPEATARAWALAALLLAAMVGTMETAMGRGTGESIPLPAPRLDGPMSVEQAVAARRSVRAFADAVLTLENLGQLLWAAQGVTHADGLRAAPSAGATYPLSLYVAAGAVAGLGAGTYRYEPDRHGLTPVGDGDVRGRLARAAFGQGWVETAPAIIAVVADYDRTTDRYGDRAVRYVHVEAGHAAENVYLQATALGLATTAVGAFHDDAVRVVLDLPRTLTPLLLLPVGVPAD